jgi:diguanylate cyclase (GGDEF)-like protein
MQIKSKIHPIKESGNVRVLQNDLSGDEEQKTAQKPEASVNISPRVTPTITYSMSIGTKADRLVPPPISSVQNPLIFEIAVPVVLTVLGGWLIFKGGCLIVKCCVRLYEDNQSLSDYAFKDQLTGIWNRRAFDEDLDKGLVHVASNGSSLGLILLDMDEFKTINDTRGHRAGDEALKALAALIDSLIPANSRAYRIGGDEFAILLTDPSPSETSAVLSQLQHPANPELKFSFGFASSDVVRDRRDVDASRRELMEAADRELYEAKSRKRSSSDILRDTPVHANGEDH